MATGLLQALERVNIGTKTGSVSQSTCGEKAVDLCEIAERRASQSVLAVECVRELTGIKRNRHFVLCWIVKRLSQVEIGAALRIEGAKEPKLVLLDWSTDIAAEVSFRKAICGRAGERKVLYAAHQAFGSSIAKHVAVEFVAATLGNNVKNSAGGLAVLRAVGAGLDFYFLYKLKREVRSRSAESGVGRVNAVENVVIFRSGRAGDRRIAITTGRISQTRTGYSWRNRVKTLDCPLG